MRRRHSRLGEQNERGFWPKRARSVGERIRNPDGTRSTHLPGPAALWVLHTAAPPPKDVCMHKHVTLWNHSQAQGDHMPCFAEQPCFYFCYFSIPSGFILKHPVRGNKLYGHPTQTPLYATSVLRLCCLPTSTRTLFFPLWEKGT